MQSLNITFKALLEKSDNKAGWTYVVWPESASYFKTKGLVKVEGTVEGIAFKSSFMALGDGRHKLPVKAEIRKLIGKEVGDEIHIHLLKRLN